MKKIKLGVIKSKIGMLIMFIFKFVIIPIFVLLLAIRIFVVKVNERELFFSNEAYVSRAEIQVGSEGYGNVSSIGVSVGDFVHKGDILYKYNNSELDTKIFELQKQASDLLLESVPDANISINEFNKNIEFLVRAKVDGVIKEININVGDFVTKEEYTMVMESSEAYVSSFIKVPVEYITKITPGLQTIIKVNNLELVGFVKDVSPDYDPELNLLEVEILVSSKEAAKIDLKNIISGTPVEVIVVSPDAFTQRVKDFVNRININLVKRFLTYEI